MRRGLEMYKQTIDFKNNPKSEARQETPKKNDNNLSIKNEIPQNSPDKSADKFIKTGVSKDSVNLKVTEEPKESKYRRIAKFLILIGSGQAADILAQLDTEQVEKISKEIALIKTIKPEEGKAIFEEFHMLFSGQYRFSGVSYGGVETARRILYAAKGPEKGEALLNKAVPETKENLFSFLEEFSPEQIAMLLKTESAQTAAMLLSRLSPKLSAGTLSKLPPDIKPEVLKRIAHQGKISPEVLEQVSAALKEKVRHISGGARDLEINGMQTLAAILKQGDYAFGDRLINELEETIPDIGKDLKEKLYTLDDVIYTVDRPIQDKLAAMSERDIATLLKGRKQEFCEKILSCVSAGRRQIIRQESEILGAVPKRECDAAASEFLSWFRLARENGDIILYSDKDVVL